MGKEAVMIWYVDEFDQSAKNLTLFSLDNSEYMRNSDFSPSRFEAQEDACNLISGKKTRDNVENVVGLMTTAGRNGCEVLVSLSQDPGKLLTAMHKIKLGGEADLVRSIQIARVCPRATGLD